MMYNSLIIEHFSKTTYIGEIIDRDFELKIGNPVCGDKIHIHLKCNSDRVIQDAKFKAYGCATSIATASIFTEFIINKSLNEVLTMTPNQRSDMLGELEPAHMHCYEILEQLFAQIEEINEEM
jgi:nitrogen fixation NifU-like protein